MEDEIRVADDATLLSKEYVQALATELVRMDLSRQGTTRWLLSVLFAFKDRGGRILDGDGKPIPIGPDIEDQIYTDDLSCSWNSAVKVFKDRPPKRRAKRSILLRLQCFDAALRIEGRPIMMSK